MTSKKPQKKKPKSKYDLTILITSVAPRVVWVHILLELERIANTLEELKHEGVPMYKIP